MNLMRLIFCCAVRQEMGSPAQDRLQVSGFQPQRKSLPGGLTEDW